MKQENQEQQRTRKVYAQKGERSQRMMSFRLDNDLVEWLSQQPNKGRYLNDLMRADMETH